MSTTETPVSVARAGAVQTITIDRPAATPTGGRHGCPDERSPRFTAISTRCWGPRAERALLADVGMDNEVLDSGCCGLAGNFGFERGHYEVSVAAGERVLLPSVRAASEETLITADGFSCRTQIAGLTDRRALHLAEVLQLALSGAEK